MLTEISKYLYEDPAFTDLVLSNIVAENPADSKSIWIERDAPLWVESEETESDLKEVFTLDHIGNKSDFRLLTRICYKPDKRATLKNELEDFSLKLSSIINNK